MPFFDFQDVDRDLMLPHLGAALVEPELKPDVPPALPTSGVPVEHALPCAVGSAWRRRMPGGMVRGSKG